MMKMGVHVTNEVRQVTNRARCNIGMLASDFKCPDRGKGKGNFEVPFSRFPEPFRARSRLYRSQILQVNTRWKALVEIYTMHSFAPFSNLNFFVKNRQNFFAIELMNIH